MTFAPEEFYIIPFLSAKIEFETYSYKLYNARNNLESSGIS